MSFYRLKQFQCEVTGKSGLDYFQALDSERQEAKTLHTRFSEPLKPAVLKAVQWRMSQSYSLLVPISVSDVLSRGYGPPGPSGRGCL
jgi:ATP-utilising chromatin assembly and remodelling N-terminal